jgi:outer membrane protein assembly factor BamD
MNRTLSRTVCAVTLVSILLAAAAGCSARKKKRTVGAAGVNTEETFQAGITALEKRDFRKARTTLERLTYANPEQRQVYEPLARLRIADSTFYLGDTLSLIDARSLYLDFVTIYGDHPLAPYAQLQAGVCSLKQVNHPSRDQSQTFQAIQDLTEVERRYPTSPYTRVARQRVNAAVGNLAEHDFIVGRFYLKRKRYEAAAARFRTILQRYPEFDEMEKVYFHLGKALILQGNVSEGSLYLTKLGEDYPNSRYGREAERLLATAEVS